jgi:hypothetical protein
MASLPKTLIKLVNRSVTTKIVVQGFFNGFLRVFRRFIEDFLLVSWGLLWCFWEFFRVFLRILVSLAGFVFEYFIDYSNSDDCYARWMVDFGRWLLDSIWSNHFSLKWVLDSSRWLLDFCLLTVEFPLDTY